MSRAASIIERFKNLSEDEQQVDTNLLEAKEYEVSLEVGDSVTKQQFAIVLEKIKHYDLQNSGSSDTGEFFSGKESDLKVFMSDLRNHRDLKRADIYTKLFIDGEGQFDESAFGRLQAVLDDTIHRVRMSDKPKDAKHLTIMVINKLKEKRSAQKGAKKDAYQKLIDSIEIPYKKGDYVPVSIDEREYDFSKFDQAKLPQINRILDKITALETARSDEFQKKNPYFVQMGANLKLLTDRETELVRALSKRADELQVQGQFTDRGLSNNNELKEYNKLVAQLARIMKVPRNSLRQKSMSDLLDLMRQHES
jgi:hypothetical protein